MDDNGLFICYQEYNDSEYNLYYPVITLDSSVSIKSFANCSDGNVRGSKDCPFELEKKSI